MSYPNFKAYDNISSSVGSQVFSSIIDKSSGFKKFSSSSSNDLSSPTKASDFFGNFIFLFFCFKSLKIKI